MAAEAAIADSPGTEQADDESQPAVGARWNFLVSLAWLFLGWSLARLAPWSALGPAWFETLLNLLPLVITVGLIAWNLWASLQILGRTGRAKAAVPLTLLQVVLFALLFHQIAWHRGADHYVWDGTPGFLDWPVLVLVHAIRAADLMDAIEAYGLRLQPVHNASHLTACVLILYHLVIDLFVLRLLMEGVDRWKRSLMEGGRSRVWVRWVSIAVVIGFVLIWLVSAIFLRPWRMWDMVLWPVDNLLRVLDFFDATEIYRIRLHQVPRLPWEGTLTLVCRVLMAIALAGVLSRIFQNISLRWLQGRGLNRQELELIARQHEDGALRQTAAQRAAELKRREEHPSRVRWPKPMEVLMILAPAYVLAICLFHAGRGDASTPLAAAAAGADEALAGRALHGIRRMGVRAAAAIDSLRASLPKLTAPRQRAVLQTLGYLGPSAVETLTEWLRHEESETRLAAVRALEGIGPAAVPGLITALASQDVELRASAKAAICELGEQAVQPLLDHMAPNNASHIVEILESLDPYWHLRTSENSHFAVVVASREAESRARSAPEKQPWRDSTGYSVGYFLLSLVAMLVFFWFWSEQD